MTRIILHGCFGRMGKKVEALIDQDENVEIVAGIDALEGNAKYPTFTNIDDCDIKADCIIDFANAAAVDRLLDYCVAKKIPLVLCTTGLSDEQEKKVVESSKQVAILKSANMSIGINLLDNVLRQISDTLAKSGFNIEVVEAHHNRKLDAPSGTALSLAHSIQDSLSESYELVYDRSSRRQARPKNEIGVSAVRGGGIVGEHDIIFVSETEKIELSHTAFDRAVFASGAVAAAKYLQNKEDGLYNMKEVISQTR